jgi:hypothetical protein
LLSGRKPFRCRSCRKRFYATAESAPGAKRNRAESAKRRRLSRRRETLVYACAMMAFAVVVFLITRER